MTENLVTYKKLMTKAYESWPAFLKRRNDRLVQINRSSTGAERVVEHILNDLFTNVLDWNISDINHQMGYADFILTQLGIKHLVIEAKRPGSFTWNKQRIDNAINQARRYAEEQKIKKIGICDGKVLYIANLENGGLQDRILLSLDKPNFPEPLWWVSMHGIYRSKKNNDGIEYQLLSNRVEAENLKNDFSNNTLLHHKYKIPAHCFAYVGNANDTKTWKLPYLLESGQVDTKRLPKAIQSILSNYRGSKVSGIPENAIPDVLERLAHAAKLISKFPNATNQSNVYSELEMALNQFD